MFQSVCDKIFPRKKFILLIIPIVHRAQGTELIDDAEIDLRIQNGNQEIPIRWVLDNFFQKKDGGFIRFFEIPVGTKVFLRPPRARRYGQGSCR